MPVICKNHNLFLKYKNKFEAAEVEIRPIIAGDMTKQVFYKKYIKKNENCPNADFIHKNGFYFPNNPELTKSEVKLLCKLLEK
jgi:CDP-6-deoxy-D-xylo-4-hexulose-3-dehydrase